MLTDWQQSVFNHHREQLESASDIDAIERAACGFLRSTQKWLLGGLCPIYARKLREIRGDTPKETIVLIDAMNWIFADWSVDCSPSSACKRFGSRLRSVRSSFNAKWVAVAGESDGENDRKKLFPKYKSSRAPHDEGVEQTLQLVKQGCSGLGVPFVQDEGKEADDVIATIATRAAIRGDRAIICTTDRDSQQLLRGDTISIFKKGALYSEDDYKNDTGLEPKQFVDYISIVGKDDVPGWSGIGDKTAKELLIKYGDFMGIWDHAHELTEAKQKSLAEFSSWYFTAKRLHTVDRWLDFPFNWEQTLAITKG